MVDYIIIYLTIPLRMTFGYFQFSHNSIIILSSKSWCIRIGVLVFGSFLPRSGWLLGVVITGYRICTWLGFDLSCCLTARKVIQWFMNTPMVPHPCQPQVLFYLLSACLVW